ncbi:MAG: hypothetical protein AAF629_15880, partial [Chloroflexota bacterium]
MEILDVAALEKALAVKQREPEVVKAIDHIRDSVSDPTMMLTEIVTFLEQHFQANLCLLYLLDTETNSA